MISPQANLNCATIRRSIVTSSSPDVPDGGESIAARRLGEVHGGWRLDAILGEAPIHVVYAASDRKGAQSAVRWMLSSTRNHAGVRRRAFREAGAIRQLAHPGTVEILAADITSEGDPFVVMERLYGTDVKRWIRLMGGPLPAPLAVAVALQASQVLAAAHQADVVHRQIQPATIFATLKGDVRVLDFGGALLPRDIDAQDFGALGVLPGPATAPELLDPAALGDARADVFGLGVVLASMIAGRTPPLSMTQLALHELLTHAQEALVLVEASVATTLSGLLKRMTAWDPAARPANCGLVVPYLQELAGRIETPSVEAQRALVKDALRDLLPTEEAGAAPRAFLDAQLLRQIFERIERVFYHVRRSGWYDDETVGCVRDVVATVVETIGSDNDGIGFTIRQSSFEVQGRPVWEPRPPFDEIPYRLFDAGFRQLRLLPGLTAEDCRRWLRWLGTDPDTDLSPEDDLATHFWRHEFKAISADLVSAVVLQDLREYDLLEEELRALRSDALDLVQHTVRARLQGLVVDSEETTGADAQLGALASRGSNVVISEASREAMGAIREQFAGDQSTASLRLAHQLVRVWMSTDDHDAVRLAYNALQRAHWMHGDPLACIELLAWVCRFCKDVPTLRAFATPLQSTDAARAILGAVREAPRTRSDIPARTLGAWTHAWLNLAGPLGIEPAVAALAMESDPLMLTILERYVAQHVGGRAQWVLTHIADADDAGAAALMRATWDAGDPRAIEVTHEALNNPRQAVRLEAIGHLSARAPEAALRAFQTLLKDTEAHVRRAAIDVAVSTSMRGAYDVLHRRIKEEGFDALPYAERAACLVAMFDLDRVSAEGHIAHQLLEEGAFSNADRDQTRILMAKLLSERAIDDETLRTMKTLTGIRFWTAKPVRQAARAAVARLEERLAEMDRSTESESEGTS